MHGRKATLLINKLALEEQDLLLLGWIPLVLAMTSSILHMLDPRPLARGLLSMVMDMLDEVMPQDLGHDQGLIMVNRVQHFDCVQLTLYTL